MKCARTLLLGLVLAASGAAGCGGSSGRVGTSQTTSQSVTTEGRLRKLEAFQSRNPDWLVELDGNGRIVASSRWSSIVLSDIRPDVDAFVRINGADVGATLPGMVQVLSEPTHVRYERPLGAGGKSVDFVDARLVDGRIVIVGRRVD